MEMMYWVTTYLTLGLLAVSIAGTPQFKTYYGGALSKKEDIDAYADVEGRENASSDPDIDRINSYLDNLDLPTKNTITTEERNKAVLELRELFFPDKNYQHETYPEDIIIRHGQYVEPNWKKDKTNSTNSGEPNTGSNILTHVSNSIVTTHQNRKLVEPEDAPINGGYSEVTRQTSKVTQLEKPVYESRKPSSGLFRNNYGVNIANEQENYKFDLTSLNIYNSQNNVIPRPANDPLGSYRGHANDLTKPFSSNEKIIIKDTILPSTTNSYNSGKHNIKAPAKVKEASYEVVESSPKPKRNPYQEQSWLGPSQTAFKNSYQQTLSYVDAKPATSPDTTSYGSSGYEDSSYRKPLLDAGHHSVPHQQIPTQSKPSSTNYDEFLLSGHNQETNPKFNTYSPIKNVPQSYPPHYQENIRNTKPKHPNFNENEFKNSFTGTRRPQEEYSHTHGNTQYGETEYDSEYHKIRPHQASGLPNHHGILQNTDHGHNRRPNSEQKPSPDDHFKQNSVSPSYDDSFPKIKNKAPLNFRPSYEETLPKQKRPYAVEEPEPSGPSYDGSYIPEDKPNSSNNYFQNANYQGEGNVKYPNRYQESHIAPEVHEHTLPGPSFHESVRVKNQDNLGNLKPFNRLPEAQQPSPTHSSAVFVSTRKTKPTISPPNHWKSKFINYNHRNPFYGVPGINQIALANETPKQTKNKQNINSQNTQNNNQFSSDSGYEGNSLRQPEYNFYNEQSNNKKPFNGNSHGGTDTAKKNKRIPTKIQQKPAQQEYSLSNIEGYDDIFGIGLSEDSGQHQNQRPQKPKQSGSNSQKNKQKPKHKTPVRAQDDTFGQRVQYSSFDEHGNTVSSVYFKTGSFEVENNDKEVENLGNFHSNAHPGSGHRVKGKKKNKEQNGHSTHNSYDSHVANEPFNEHKNRDKFPSRPNHQTYDDQPSYFEGGTEELDYIPRPAFTTHISGRPHSNYDSPTESPSFHHRGKNPRPNYDQDNEFDFEQYVTSRPNNRQKAKHTRPSLIEHPQEDPSQSSVSYQHIEFESTDDHVHAIGKRRLDNEGGRKKLSKPFEKS